jgi:sialate O-acetylesterase
MNVPSYWESQGYKDYDGFAWYRVRFRLPADLQDRRVILLLGKIDDFDETYLNGHKIGHTGTMESRSKDIPGSEAYQQLRAYILPPDDINRNGENVLAVRVYDGYRDGGIYAGPIGIVTQEKYVKWNNRKQHQKENFLEWLFR